MIRRGEMLYRYAPELMSKVFDPSRKAVKPGVSPSFAEAMDGPLGPMSPPPMGGAAGQPPKPGSHGPAPPTTLLETHSALRMRGDDDAAAEAGGEEKKDAAKEEKGGDKKGKDDTQKKMSEIDIIIKNPIVQQNEYPKMYKHWDNYMFPMRQRPLPPRWYPHPKKGYSPVIAFPPAAALFENPLQETPPLQRVNGLFQNPRGTGMSGRGLQPVEAPFAPIGKEAASAPSPYQFPVGYLRGDPNALGPKNQAIFPQHPLPLQKWYQKFLQPAEPPKMTTPPGAKEGEGGEAAADAGGSGGF